jgi:succinoglycan biosynthesis transport protein ExoP
MLQRINVGPTDPNFPVSGGAPSPTGIDLNTTLTFIKESRRIVICWTLIGLALAIGYALTAVPEYTAFANVILDARKIQVFKDAPVVGDNAIDAAEIENQVEIIRSEAIAYSVVKALELSDDPEFASLDSPVMTLLWPFGVGEKSDQERERGTVRAVRRKLGVRRLGVTSVLEISYRSTDPEKAARITNAVVDAYISDQLDSKYQATKRASTWLQERIEELRHQSESAAKAAQEFKTKNNLVDTGNRGLISDQQIQELSSQLIIATSHAAEMHARLGRIEDVLRAPAPDGALGTVSETLTSPVIVRLRQQYLDLRKREAELSVKYGRQHLVVVNLRNEMLELQRSILAELKRIADSYRSDYEIAKSREESIKNSLQALVKQADTTGQAQIGLKALESSASTYRSILDNFLQKNTEAVQQQSFPISYARVITRAETPISKSFPKTTLLVLLGTILGATGGVAHSLAAKSLDRTIRVPRELMEKFRVNCLGLIPVISPRLRHNKDKIAPKVVVATSYGRSQLVGWGDSGALLRRPARCIQDRDSTMRKSVTEPFSRFAESLRSVKTSIELMAVTRSIKFIGILSALPGEGKTTVAANLASLFAKGGAKTLLLDADLRNPGLSQHLAPQAQRGLRQVLRSVATLNGALWLDPDTGLEFLPAGVKGRIADSADLVGCERFKTLMLSFSERFDYIVIDLPPLGATVDARAISPLIDGFIIVVEWGKTHEGVLQEALISLGAAREKIIGGVLNKANYREINNVYYYNESYERYGGSRAS